jgi:hypothetical protein
MLKKLVEYERMFPSDIVAELRMAQREGRNLCLEYMTYLWDLAGKLFFICDCCTTTSTEYRSHLIGESLVGPRVKAASLLPNVVNQTSSTPISSQGDLFMSMLLLLSADHAFGVRQPA